MTELSIQLYSARLLPSMRDFLGKVAELGYSQVEGFGGLYADPVSLSTDLQDVGLTMPTGHFDLDQLSDTTNAIGMARTIGVKKIICPWIAPEQRTNDDAGWKNFAQALARIGDIVTAEGLGFGWHNHDFEFHPTTSGTLPMDILMDAAPNLEWECDVAWMIRGGVNPISWFDRYGDRITAVHVKDIAPEGQNVDEGGWADVGHGIVGWDKLVGEVKSRTKAEYLVAEHDLPVDPVRFASRSIAAAKNWK